MNAIKYNVLAFTSIPDKYITKEMCVAAVEQNPKLLQCVPKSLIDIELCNIAMDKIQDKKYFSDDIFVMDKFINHSMKNDFFRILNIRQY